MLFIITELSNNNSNNLSILQEKLSREDRNRLKFKKYYNFEPSKEDKDIGFITDKKTGKRYKVDMKDNGYVIGKGKLKIRNTESNIRSSDSSINLDRNFFKLKGSNHNERRKAALDHEIAHQNLHNTNSNNKTVDRKNKSGYVYAKVSENPNIKTISKFDIDNGNAEDLNNRINSYKKAEKYEGNGSHEKAYEFEADRFSANRNGENALKKALRNGRKISKSDKEIKRVRKLSNTVNAVNAIINRTDIPDSIESNEKDVKKYRIDKNKEFDSDYLHRIKALKDKDLKNSDIYK